MRAGLLIVASTVVLCGLPQPSVGDELKTKADVEAVCERVMKHAAKFDLRGAFDLMKIYSHLPEPEFEAVALQSISQRDQFKDRLGTSIGWEHLSTTEAGSSILKLVYLEKTDKHGLIWTFFFYRPAERWQLNTFSWGDKLAGAFHD